MDSLKVKRNVGNFTVEVKREDLLKALGLTEKEIESCCIEDIDAYDEDENGNEVIRFYFNS